MQIALMVVLVFISGLFIVVRGKYAKSVFLISLFATLLFGLIFKQGLDWLSRQSKQSSALLRITLGHQPLLFVS